MLKFDQKVAVISGGGRGIGRAYALLLASRGCRIIIADAGFELTGAPGVDDPGRELAAAINATGGNALSIRADVLSDANKIIEFTLDHFDRLNILINNAGPVGSFDLFHEASEDAWQQVVDTHYKGTVAMCRAAWPHLVSCRSGRIINTASSAMLGSERQTDYGSAKAAIFGLTRSLAIEGLERGVTVNCVLPSGFTRMMGAIPDLEIRATAERLLNPNHIAALVAWLVHDKTLVTGEAVLVGGGRAARIVIASGRPVKVIESTPEMWSEAGGQLFKDSPLVPLTTMAECFATELRDLDPLIHNQINRYLQTGLKITKV